MAWVVGVVLVIAYWQYRDVRHQVDVRNDLIYRLCSDSKENREKIRESLKRSFANMGYRWDEQRQEPVFVGPPSLKYYRENPGEIPTQLERLSRELEEFPSISCDPPIEERREE